MSFLLRLLLGGLAVYFSAVLLNLIFPGSQPVYIRSYLIAVIVSVLISVVNMTIGPILRIITFPINVLSLGLFSLVLNGVLLLIIPPVMNMFFVSGGFSIGGATPLATLGWAIVYATLVSFVQSTLHVLVK